MGNIPRSTSANGGNTVTDDALKVNKAFFIPSGSEPTLNDFTSQPGMLFSKFTSTSNGRLYHFNGTSWDAIAKLSEAGGGSGSQSDWDETDPGSPSYIQNKPTIPTNTNQLTNGAGFITASSSDSLTNKSGNISQWTNDSAYLTGITSGQVTTALGFTPYNATNPSGYITASSSNDLTNKTGNISQWTNDSSYIGLTALSSAATGLTYTNTTGVFSLTAGYGIPTTAKQTEWDTAYTNRITSLTTTGTSGAATLIGNTLNIPQYAGNPGTVTTVSVVSANGLAGSVANATTTPAITLSTSITGLLKGNGTAISAATSGTDYEPALTFSTGLTRTTNTITSNLSTGVSGGQNIILATGSAEGGYITSTSHSTKGKWYLNSALTMAIDEANVRIGHGTASPSTDYHFNRPLPTVRFQSTTLSQTYDFGVFSTNIGHFTLQRQDTANINTLLSVVGKGTGVSFDTKQISGSISLFGMDAVASANNELLAFEAWYQNGYGIFSSKNGTGSARPITLDATGAASRASLNQLFLSTNGNVGIGTTSPTSAIHVKAGTATANTAPFKYTSGTNLSAVENGAKEFDGTNEFLSAGGVRYTLAKTLTATATLNFDLTAVNYEDLTITLTGATDGDAVVIGVPNGAVVADVTYFGWVSAADTVTIRASRVGGGGAADPASGTFRAAVIKY